MLRNVVLIVLDTTRADVVRAADTPSIDGLALKGEQAEMAWAPSTWTCPSMVSIFTGMPISQHGWDLESGHRGEYPHIPDVPMLATVLHDAGFETAAIYANLYLDGYLGFSRGFDLYRFEPDEKIVDAFQLYVLSNWDDGKRHFAYLHFLGPHSVIDLSPESEAKYGLPDRRYPIQQAGENYPLVYRAAVEETDQLVGKVLVALAPYRDDTLVVLIGDHGELLGEHGLWGHGYKPWPELIEVPLVVSPRVGLPSHMSLVDLPSIITNALGVPHQWPTVTNPTVVSQRGNSVAYRDGSMGELPEMTLPGEVALPKETIEAIKALGYAE